MRPLGTHLLRQAVLSSAYEPSGHRGGHRGRGVVLTVIATVAVQISGRRATSRDTQKALEEQRKQLDRTLAEQRTRTLNERFATAAGQLGGDKPPAVRLAGVYAMAGLADDWPENRQTCVDVLCAYLRLPYEPDPGEDAPGPERLAFRASREVRHTVIRVITAHLQDWRGGVLAGPELRLHGRRLRRRRLRGAGFSGGRSASTAPSSPAARSASAAPSSPAAWSASTAPSSPAARSTSAAPSSPAARSTSAAPSSPAARSASTAPSSPAARSASSAPSSPAARVNFGGAEFSGGTVGFGGAEFSGGAGQLHAAPSSPAARSASAAPSSPAARSTSAAPEFSGGTVGFRDAEFSGGTVNFSGPRDWSCPPEFPWTDTPPPGVKLPNNGRSIPGVGWPDLAPSSCLRVGRAAARTGGATGPVRLRRHRASVYVLGEVAGRAG